MTPVIFVLMKKHDLKKGKSKYSGMKTLIFIAGAPILVIARIWATQGLPLQ